MFDNNIVALQPAETDATTKSNLQIIKNTELGNFSYLIIDGNPYFIAKEVCDKLEYSNPNNAYLKLDDDEKLTSKIWMAGQNRDVVLINESGLYSLILGSIKPEAKRFKKIVTSEILPSIRKHGMYATEVTIENMLNNPDYAISLLTALKEERLAKSKLQEQIMLEAPKVNYFNGLVDRKMNLCIRDVARLYGIEESILINWLIENKYIYRAVTIKKTKSGNPAKGKLKAMASYSCKDKPEQLYFQPKVLVNSPILQSQLLLKVKQHLKS